MQTKAGGKRSKVEAAVWAVGGPTKAANICGVSWYTVRQWRKKGFIPDGHCAVLLSEATAAAGEPYSVRDLAIRPSDNQPDGEPSRETTKASSPETKLHLVETPEPAGEVALVRRRFYAAPAVQRRRRHIQEKNVPFDWAA